MCVDIILSVGHNQAKSYVINYVMLCYKLSVQVFVSGPIFMYPQCTVRIRLLNKYFDFDFDFENRRRLSKLRFFFSRIGSGRVRSRRFAFSLSMEVGTQTDSCVATDFHLTLP